MPHGDMTTATQKSIDRILKDMPQIEEPYTVKQKILRLLNGDTVPMLYPREIARNLGLNQATVRRNLSELFALDMISKSEIRPLYYMAVKNREIYNLTVRAL